MATQTEIHVVPHAGVWAVKRADSMSVVSIHAVRAEAVAEGIALARSLGVDLVIHDAAGLVIARNKFG